MYEIPEIKFIYFNSADIILNSDSSDIFNDGKGDNATDDDEL